MATTAIPDGRSGHLRGRVQGRNLHGNTLLSNLLVVFILSMRTPARQQTRKRAATPAKVAAHLAASPHEFAITRFEQGLICAAAAFYRFYGVLLGREGRARNISGHDNAILQQILAASRPLAV